MPTGIAALLKNVPLFKDLDDAELAEVAEVCREEKFVSGEYIFREGENGNRLYLVTEGEVRISRDVPGSGEEALAILKPGAGPAYSTGSERPFTETETSAREVRLRNPVPNRLT